MSNSRNYKGNILVVDDTPANLRLLVDLLKENGYQVRPVPNGNLALASVKALPPDLILLDIMMPEIDGYEVCRRLKADELTQDIPVIFISAINEVLDKVKAFNVGGVDYITKPFQVEEVLARVSSHLAIIFLQRSLKKKNEEVTQTLIELQKTQSQLVQAEKMAALGQLIAGIAHEINTPLGAIRSSGENLAEFFELHLKELTTFLPSLSSEQQDYFFQLINISKENKSSLSTKEKRQIKRNLITQLEDQTIPKPEIVADTLVDLGIDEQRLTEFLSLLATPEGETILNKAYELASLLKSSQTILNATEKAAKIVFALKTYSRYDQSGEKSVADIAEGIETILTLYHNQIKKGVEVNKNYHTKPVILCYPDELNQVWNNLIHNALQAMDYQGVLTIDITGKEEDIIVKIIDTGKGVPPDLKEKIFEPFFTTKPAGEGTGLGLDIVTKILRKHQGKICLESEPGKTIFSVSLPNQQG